MEHLKLSKVTHTVERLMQYMEYDIQQMMPVQPVSMSANAVQVRLKEVRAKLYGVILEIAKTNGIDIDLKE